MSNYQTTLSYVGFNNPINYIQNIYYIVLLLNTIDNGSDSYCGSFCFLLLELYCVLCQIIPIIVSDL